MPVLIFLSNKWRKSSTLLSLLTAFILLSFSIIPDGVRAEALCYVVSSDKENVESGDTCSKRKQAMKVPSDAELEASFNSADDHQSTFLLPEEQNSIFVNAFTAPPSQVIDFGVSEFYPEGTYAQNRNLYYPDGTVVENAFSDETVRIVLPDGSILAPGEFHQVSENHVIDLQSVTRQ